jgi:gas vesicle protein
MSDEESTKRTIGGMAAGATVGGIAGGPGGALLGGLVGALAGLSAYDEGDEKEDIIYIQN